MSDENNNQKTRKCAECFKDFPKKEMILDSGTLKCQVCKRWTGGSPTFSVVVIALAFFDLVG